MKPMKVEAGQYAPDVDEMIKEAKKLLGSKTGDKLQSVRGVETVEPGIYHTNQQRIEAEDVKRTDPKKENVKLINANPHDNALPAHENSAGDKSDKNPVGAYNLTDYY